MGAPFDKRDIVQNVYDDDSKSIKTVNVDADGDAITYGNPLPVNIANDISGVVKYNFIQKDEGGTYTYYGFAEDGIWQIKRKTIATGVWEVVSGTGDYTTNWTDRASKTYGFY